MPEDDIESFWEDLRPRGPSSPSVERISLNIPSRAVVTPYEEPIQIEPPPQRRLGPELRRMFEPPSAPANPTRVNGVIDRRNARGELNTIRSLRQQLQAQVLGGPQANAHAQAQLDNLADHQAAVQQRVNPPAPRRARDIWDEFGALSEREQRIRNSAFMQGYASTPERAEQQDERPLTSLMNSLSALGVTGSVSQERLNNGNRAVTILMEPVPNETPHFRVRAGFTNRGGLEVIVEFPEE